MKIVVAVIAVSVLLSGCTTPGDYWKKVVGVSTKGIEESRADAVSKVFDYDYKTCYDKTETLLKKMPKVSVFAKTKSMIAVYVIDPNTTPVGIFFKEIDAGHTQVDVASGSTPTRDWVAKNVFAETLQKQETVKVNF